MSSLRQCSMRSCAQMVASLKRPSLKRQRAHSESSTSGLLPRLHKGHELRRICAAHGRLRHGQQAAHLNILTDISRQLTF